MRVYVDLDPYIYKVCAVLEPTFYWVGERWFDYKKEAVAYCEEKGIDLETIVKKQCIKEPYYVKRICENFIQQAESKAAKVLGKAFPGEHLDLIYVLSSKRNFRKSIDPEYKANRPEKPFYTAYVKKILFNLTKAIGADFLEADDVIAILKIHDPHHAAICSIDKDLANIPGWFYNPDKGSLVKIEPKDGIDSFLKQCLTGDSVDNIKGLPKVGPKKAQVWLEEFFAQDTEYNAYPQMWGSFLSFVDNKLDGNFCKTKFIRDAILLDVGGYYASVFKFGTDTSRAAMRNCDQLVERLINVE